MLELSNGGFNSYREFQVTGRYQLGRHLLNASYVRSKAFGDLNDFNQFFGNTQQVVIQLRPARPAAFRRTQPVFVLGRLCGSLSHHTLSSD